MVCRLVAHHSCAIIEAGERGLADVLTLEFEPAPDALSSVLTYCDMTTSPDGEPVAAGQRVIVFDDGGELLPRWPCRHPEPFSSPGPLPRAALSGQ